MVEYTLILIVTVTLLYSAKGMFQGLEKFMYSYMGEYISCLMEYGELPAQGISVTDLKKNKNGGGGGGKVCDSNFANFTLTNGVPFSGGSGSNSGGSKAAQNTANRNNSSSATGSGNSKTADKSASSNDSNFSNSSNSGPVNSSRGTVRRSDGTSGFSTADNGNGATEEKIRIIEEPETAGSGGGYDRTRSTQVIYERTRYKAISGSMAEQLDKKSVRKPSSSILKILDDSGYRRGPRTSTFLPPEKKAMQSSEDDSSGFQFGKYLKWFLIVAMLIAIIVFFGSQVMSFMNSQEK